MALAGRAFVSAATAAARLALPLALRRWEAAAVALGLGGARLFCGRPAPHRLGVRAPPGRRGQPTDPSRSARASESAGGPGSGRHESVQMEHSWRSILGRAELGLLD